MTGYNPNDKKFRMRDRERIEESRASDIMREERISYRIGREEDDEQWRILMREKERKKNRSKY